MQTQEKKAENQTQNQPQNQTQNISENQIQENAKSRRTSGKAWKAAAVIAAVVLFIVIGVIIGSSRTKDSRTEMQNITGSYETKEAVAYDTAVTEEVMYEDGDGMVYMASEPVASVSSNDADVLSEKRSVLDETQEAKIIKTANVSLKTKEFDRSVKDIEQLIEQNGGYVESQYVDNQSGSQYRSASYTARIPQENLDTFLDGTGQICTVASMSRSAEDVSEYYYDTQARLDTARIKLERLQNLLKDAKRMDDIITIEQAISDTEWEIDNLTGTVKHYDALVNFSSVTIDIQEVYEIKQEDPAPLTFAEKLSKAFRDGLESVKDMAEAFVMFLAVSWIYLVVIAVIIVVIVLIVRGKRKKKDRKSE